MKRKEALQKRVDEMASGIDRMLLHLDSTKKLRASLATNNSFTTPGKRKLREVLAIILAISTLSLTALFFATRLMDYGNWPPAAYQSPRVFNLTKDAIQWDIHYGPSRGCKDDACYINPETPASFFNRRAILPLREFPIKDWKPGDPIFYRAKVTIPEQVRHLANREPLSLHTILVWAKSWDLYLNQQLVFQGTQETMLAPIPQNFINPDGSVDIAIKVDVGDLPYQGIASRGDLVIGPRSDLAPLSFFSRDNATSLQLLYLLPKLAFCVVFSLLFIFVRTNREIGWLLLFGLTSSFELFFRSDFAADAGINGQTSALLALIARNFSMLILARFIYSFFRLNIRWVEKFIYVGFILMAIQGTFCLFGLSYAVATRQLDITAILLKPAVYVVSTTLAIMMSGILSEFERSKMRSRIALAFGILLFAGTALAFIDLAKLIANTLSIHLSLTIVNLTWIFDLILFIFMAAITGVDIALQHAHQRQLQYQLQNLNDRLELASTVQGTLLPEPMFGSDDSLAFTFRYVPAERMAGDWLFKGAGEQGSIRFILGDVTGKGPAAALAVAATIGALRQKDQSQENIEKTIHDLNHHLYNLFRGKAGTSFCLADIDKDGHTRVAIHGMAGWLHISSNKIRLISARGSTLGSHEEISTSLIELKLEPGDMLVCFSDGCLEGARAMRKLVDALNKLNKAELTADRIFETIIDIGKESVQPDDQAMMMIKKVA